MRIGLPTAALLAGSAVLACTGAQKPQPPKGTPVLTISGKVEHGPFIYGSEDLATLPQRKFKAVDPHLGREVEFSGISIGELIDKLTLAKNADTAVLRTRDGIDVAIPLIRLKVHKPVLATAMDGAPLPPELGTPYAAWPNIDDPGLDTDPRVRPWWWLANVTTVDVIEWDKTYSRALRVPSGAGDAARLGAATYGTYCVQCHKLRTVGGTRGPELTAVMKNYDLPSFTAYVGDPRSKNPKSTMPSFRALGDRTIQNVAAYLKAVQESGPLPPPKADGTEERTSR
jgi:mono/diheme cytochrome c family protein